MSDNDDYLRRDDAAAYLKSKIGFGAPATLARLAVQGGGPAFRRIGRIPVYRKSDLDEWIVEKTSPTVRSTSELGGRAA